MRAERAYAGARNYDANGNLIKKTKGATAETWNYTYSVGNQLLGVTQRATDGGTLLMQATYVYDALGDRIEKDVWKSVGGLTVTRFAYDGGNVFADLNGSNQLQTRRLYLDGVDSIFAKVSSGGATSWFLPDRLGSVRDITNASGAVVDHLDYDGFGNVINETSQTNGDRYKWTGREFDSETGLQYNWARYYDPKTGRWTSSDPLSFAAGDTNLYRYVANASTGATDPTGLKSKEEWQQEAQQLLGGATDPIERNKKITAAYAQMYLDNPNLFLWAGLAAFASNDVGYGLRKAWRGSIAAALAFGVLGKGPALWCFGYPDPEEVYTMLAEGNKAVFDDLYWQHLAYKKGGLAEIEALHSKGQLMKPTRPGS